MKKEKWGKTESVNVKNNKKDWKQTTGIPGKLNQLETLVMDLQSPMVLILDEIDFFDS